MNDLWQYSPSTGSVGAVRGHRRSAGGPQQSIRDPAISCGIASYSTAVLAAAPIRRLLGLTLGDTPHWNQLRLPERLHLRAAVAAITTQWATHDRLRWNDGAWTPSTFGDV
jgi:hypothetical protein